MPEINLLEYESYEDFCSKTGKHGLEAIQFLTNELERLRAQEKT